MSHPRGCNPLRFHTRVLPPLIRMPAWVHNSSSRTVYECKTLSGRGFTTCTSSRNAINLSSSCNRLFTATCVPLLDHLATNTRIANEPHGVQDKINVSEAGQRSILENSSLINAGNQSRCARSVPSGTAVKRDFGAHVPNECVSPHLYYSLNTHENASLL